MESVYFWQCSRNSKTGSEEMVKLPLDVYPDKSKANFKNGVLVLVLVRKNCRGEPQANRIDRASHVGSFSIFPFFISDEIKYKNNIFLNPGHAAMLKG